MTVSDLPLVSIVTPSFQQVDYLERALLSVLEQDYPRLEYIVIDGGSTDGSREILQRYAHRLAYWVSEPDLGQTEALNKGFSRATGDIFAWLNSDDALFPGTVRKAVEFLVSHAEIGMVYGGADYIDAEDRRIGRFPAAPTDYRRLRRGYVHIPQQSSFFRSRLWRMAGPLDPTYHFAMDYDLWVRIADLSPIAHVPEAWAGFRLHAGAKTLKDADRCWPEMIRIHFRDGGKPWSIIYAKYLVRRLTEPLWAERLRRRMRQGEYPGPPWCRL